MQATVPIDPACERGCVRLAECAATDGKTCTKRCVAAGPLVAFNADTCGQLERCGGVKACGDQALRGRRAGLVARTGRAQL
ncbi:MAG: hypothetical protein DRI90_20685 [Deltaproteobacteria bacterium]|nr:MAG: hypothetical protein DRI90_20685 [Deltaproteobacteria bacterium]